MSAPTLSAAVVVGAQRRRAQRVIDAVRIQTAAGSIELVVVDCAAEGASPLRVPAEVPTTVIALPGCTSLSLARAEAVRRAQTGLVAFLEDHCYPSPGWAEALLDAHRRPWAAVGYAFANANPESYVARACQMSDYGLWTHPARGGPARLLPGNNVSYRRDLLLSLGDELDRLLIVDFNLQDTLRRQGHELAIEPRALVYHENFNAVADLGRASYAYCRLMAINRARHGEWGAARRFGYAATVPFAVPLLKLGRLAYSLRGRPSLVPVAASALPVVLAVGAWSAVGEARGYLERTGDEADADFTRWELEATRAG